MSVTDCDNALLVEKKDVSEKDILSSQGVCSDTINDGPVPELQFWCEKCREMRQLRCPEHGKPSVVYDRPIVSRALASLPSGVTASPRSADSRTGAFSQKIFTANSIFGPFIAHETETNIGGDFPLMVTKGGKSLYLDYTDEEKCNWMMFVRPAELWVDVNVVVYEVNGELYYVTIKCVQYNQELRVAYSQPYADKYNLKTPSTESRVHKCERCGLSFQTQIGKISHKLSSKCQGKPKRGRTKSPVVKARMVKSLKSTSPKPNKVRSNAPPVDKRTRLCCPVCHIGFDQTVLMSLHMLSHKSEAQTSSEELTQTSEELTQTSEELTQTSGELTQTSGELTQTSGETVEIRTCPACAANFDTQVELIEHIGAEHSKRVGKPVVRVDEMSDSELVMDVKEQQTPADVEGSSTYCQICKKSIGSVRAYNAHMRSHSRPNSYYGCFLCDEKFSCSRAVFKHVTTHAVDGVYTCPQCPNRRYDNWRKCRKHVNSVHTGQEFRCELCSKVFCRLDRLKVHMTTHQDVKDFMCDVCGKQFSRKDKLVDHLKRVHEDGQVEERSRSKPDTLPADYHKHIYKCNICVRHFKRRGMLVSHMANFHSSVPLTSIPELNIPLLKPQKEYLCPHCLKAYQSAAKRKAHIQKMHPGAQIPPGVKNKNFPDVSTCTQPAGNISHMPYTCQHCHKQYSTKANLTQHNRHKHSNLYVSTDKQLTTQTQVDHRLATSDVVTLIQPLDSGTNEPVAISLHTLNLGEEARVDNSDILTQAMSVNELQATLDFQNQTQGLGQNAVQVGMNTEPLELRILPNSNNIDLTNLQLSNIQNSTLSFTVPSSSVSSSQSMQQNALSHMSDTPNLNSVASHTSPRSNWPYPFKLS